MAAFQFAAVGCLHRLYIKMADAAPSYYIKVKSQDGCITVTGEPVPLPDIHMRAQPLNLNMQLSTDLPIWMLAVFL